MPVDVSTPTHVSFKPRSMLLCETSAGVLGKQWRVPSSQRSTALYDLISPHTHPHPLPARAISPPFCVGNCTVNLCRPQNPITAAVVVVVDDVGRLSIHHVVQPTTPSWTECTLL